MMNFNKKHFAATESLSEVKTSINHQFGTQFFSLYVSDVDRSFIKIMNFKLFIHSIMIDVLL